MTYRDHIEFVPIDEDPLEGLREAVSNAFEGEAVLRAAKYQQEKGLTPFDSVHAALAEPDGRLLGSDCAYDDLDLERVPLEPEADDD